MQSQCPHYMVKADGSDGAVMYDTVQAFCRPGFLTQQAITLSDVIDAAKRQMDSMPAEHVKPTLDTLEQIQAEMSSTAAAVKAKSFLGAEVSDVDKEEIKDREEEIAELITKLKAKVGQGAPAIKDVAKASSELALQVSELGLKVKTITVPTALAIPQRKLGAGEVIVHAAGVLQDGLIVPNIQKAPDMFSKVYAAKAHGAWQLHRALTAL